MKIVNWIKKHWVYHYGDPIYTKSKISGKSVTVFYIRAPHHLYLGIALLLMSWLSAPYYPKTTLVTAILGSYITLDDLVEHLITYKTPLRWLFDKFNVWLI